MSKETTPSQDRKVGKIIPSKGERVEYFDPESRRTIRGVVHYADQLQILVKWDDGTSRSLRVGIDVFQLVA